MSGLSQNDPSSFSIPEEARVKHIHLELNVDFSSQVLKGKVVLQVEKCQEKAVKLVLDTRDICVHSVTDAATGSSLAFNIGKTVASFGAPLEVTLPKTDKKDVEVSIAYETSTKCTALQWLKPEQTAGKKHPYLFSQCQAIHARSLLPCQDTPSVKAAYTAKISCPAQLVALMSAVKQETKSGEAGQALHQFQQKVPIPSYLIALVVGALESRKIGPRSHVWSEAATVESAAYEFAETEQMLTTAESLMGPYVWGVYDLLVLPPSFPYGGMENPCLTFVTPTLLAGDRSLATVVAHEIAHSWTGNLVTNATWEHFWLNEGFTVFAERKIGGRLYSEKFRQFDAMGGWKDLQYQVGVFGEKHAYTHLVPDLKGVDPDDAFSTVPYEKGSSLLMHLEEKLGGPAVFEPYLLAYINEFKYKSLTTKQWKEFLYSYFSSQKKVLDSVDWEAWFHSPGMPPVKPKYDETLAIQCTKLCRLWADLSQDADLKSFTADEFKELSSFQVREFLSQLLEEKPLTANKIEKMRGLYGLDKVNNSEVRFRWLRLCLRARIESVIGDALQFVNSQGRLKFVRPIYRDLSGWDTARQQAVDNFRQQSPSMHGLSSTMVGKDLGVSP